MADRDTDASLDEDHLRSAEERTPVTYVSLTRTGRRALEDYVGALRRLLTPTTDQPRG
jgi:predicted subunit of tRNA(5-methylaminomethyl-2-thiouridylate) methyltransferase